MERLETIAHWIKEREVDFDSCTVARKYFTEYLLRNYASSVFYFMQKRGEGEKAFVLCSEETFYTAFNSFYGKLEALRILQGRVAAAAMEIKEFDLSLIA